MSAHVRLNLSKPEADVRVVGSRLVDLELKSQALLNTRVELQ